MRFYWHPTPLADLISPLSSSLGCTIGSTAVVHGRYTNSFFFLFFFFSCLKSLTYSYTWTDSAIESANTSWKSARPKTGIVFFLLFRSLWRLWKARGKGGAKTQNNLETPHQYQARARAHTHTHTQDKWENKERERGEERDGWMKTEREGIIDECQIRFHLLHSCSLRHRAIGFFITHQNPDLILASYFAFYRPTNLPSRSLTLG